MKQKHSRVIQGVNWRCGCGDAHDHRDDKSSFHRGLTLGDRWFLLDRKRGGGSPTSPWAAAAGTSYFFFVSKDPSLQSVCSLGHEPGATRPRQMFRDACPFIPAYYVLILGAGSCKARNTRPTTDRSMHMHDSLGVRARAREHSPRRMRPSADWRRDNSWLFDRLHACRANPLRNQSRVFRMVNDAPVLRFLQRFRVRIDGDILTMTCFSVSWIEIDLGSWIIDRCVLQSER